jgi:hypothetical protein
MAIHLPTRSPAPDALAAALKARLALVFAGLGWRHDDVALDMYRHAEQLARYVARVSEPLGAARPGALAHTGALAAADQLDAHLSFLHRTGAVHGVAVPAARRTLARLVGVLGGAPRGSG